MKRLLILLILLFALPAYAQQCSEESPELARLSPAMMGSVPVVAGCTSGTACTAAYCSSAPEGGNGWNPGFGNPVFQTFQIDSVGTKNVYSVTVYVDHNTWTCVGTASLEVRIGTSVDLSATYDGSGTVSVVNPGADPDEYPVVLTTHSIGLTSGTTYYIGALSTCSSGAWRYLYGSTSPYAYGAMYEGASGWTGAGTSANTNDLRAIVKLCD